MTNSAPTDRLWSEPPPVWKLLPGDEVYRVNPSYHAGASEVDYIEMDGLDVELPWPRYIGKRDPSSYSGQMFAPGDTVFARITPCTENGKTGLVPSLQSEVGIGSTEFIVLSPRKRVILPHYLYYVVKSYPVRNYAISRMRGSTGRQRVPSAVFRRELRIPVPPLDEQRKIASVLYTVDQLIEKTKALIERIERVKWNLMCEFFSSGYLEHEVERGRWQNYAQQKPVGWQVRKAADSMEITRGASPRPKGDPELFGGDIPWIKISDVDRSGSQSVSITEDTVTEKGSRKSKLVEPGTLLVANSGTVGFAVFAGARACVHDGWLILRDYQDVFDKKYLYHFINWNQEYLKALAPGSTQVNLNTQRFGLLDIFQPEIVEQRKIADCLDCLDEIRFQNNAYKATLSRLKTGLIQDLLSGKVRTEDKDIEVIDEVAAYG